MSTNKPHLILDPVTKMLSNASISDLDDLHVGIMDFGDKYPLTYHRLMRIPFIRRLSDAIDKAMGDFYSDDDDG